jgi:hypothetical protein
MIGIELAWIVVDMSSRIRQQPGLRLLESVCQSILDPEQIRDGMFRWADSLKE